MKSYDHKKIEKKWQKTWADKKIYKTLDAKSAKAKGKKPYYVLDMFPYLSGAGLHVGHPRGYIASDVFARMKRMQGFNVLHPMGFDSFGLPAEQYAIKTGNSPKPFTEKLMKDYRKQLEILGFDYDWSHEVSTMDPDFYRWTQWIFLQIYNSWYDRTKQKARSIDELVKIFEKSGNENIDAVCDEKTPMFSAKQWKVFSEMEQQNILMKYRLAYEGYAEVNWCAELGTVLANDEVIEKDGKMVSERGEYPVVKKQMRQWFMRITAYADRLLAGLETIDWSNSIKEIQKNWIGKSEGSEIEFVIKNHDQKIKVFTTRADTLFGVTYVVLAPEHQLVSELKSQIKNWNDVEQYITNVKTKSDEDRTAAKEKTGVELKGVFATNPANGEQVPVWIADYVLANYGTGAVMAVPAHDERDFEFAQKYKLPIKHVVSHKYALEGIDAERPNAETIYRKTVDAIIRDTDNNFYLIKEDENHVHFVGGGIEEGETEKEALFREIKEEVGFTDITVGKKIVPYVTCWEYRHTKGVNVRSYGPAYEVILNSTTEISSEIEQGKHKLVKVSKNEVLKAITWEHHRFIFEQFLKDESSYDDYGILIDSGKFNGMTSEQARKSITEFVGGKLVTKYKMRDAIFARQRYWGEPIPLIYQSLEQKYPKAFTVPFYNEFPFELISKKEKTVETRSLDKPGRDKVKTGDVLRIEHLPTERVVYAKVTAAWRFKSIRDMWNKNPELVKEIRPEANIRSYEELYEFYKNVDKGYENRCDTYGLVAWRLELLEGSFISEIPDKQLPLKLPNVKSYEPSGNGEGPLATVSAWVKSGYETNTMPGWAGSSWYFLRYTDPTNKKAFAGEKELDYWFGKNGGVNMYVGGSEHATGHLLYSRFWHKFLKDLGYVKAEEPFQTLRNQGMIGGADGRKMSKRYGNVINPDDVVAQFGADTLRVYESFMGPFEAHLPWSTDGIVGSRRFIERIWRFAEKVSDKKSHPDLEKVLHKTIKKVTDDIAGFGFNTAVSAMMIFANELEKHESIDAKDWVKFLQILAPFAPHIADELWSALGNKQSIHIAPWPSYDAKKVIDDTVTIGVQVNGKVRAEITVKNGESEESVKEKVLALQKIQEWIEGKEIRKFIYVPGKIINVVV